MHIILIILIFTIGLFYLYPILKRIVVTLGDKILKIVLFFVLSFVLFKISFFNLFIKLLNFFEIIKLFLSFKKQYKNSPRNQKIKDSFEILNLDETATIDNVNQAYKELMKIHHPDKGGSEEKACKIIEARDILIKYLMKE